MLENIDLSSALIERILDKLGLSDRPAVDLNGLQTLYRLWCQNIPFDNILKLIHINSGSADVLPGNNPTDYFENWLKYGTGGTCWAANGALHALLSALGFSASRALATMMIAPGLPPNHGTVVVNLNQINYLVDACILHNVPLRLDKEHEFDVNFPSWVKRVYQIDSKWCVLWFALRRLAEINCRIDCFPVTAQEFSKQYEMTRLWSPFNYELSIASIRDDSVIGIVEGKRVQFSANGINLQEDFDKTQWYEFLINEMGIHEEIIRKLPPDRPTPPPPWSRTAQNMAGS